MTITVAAAREAARDRDTGRFGTQERHEPTTGLLEALEPESPESTIDRSHEVSMTLSAHLVPDAVKLIEKANRRAERAGIAERFTYDLDTWTEQTVDDSGFEVFEDKARIRLNRPTISHEGWTFAATLTWDEETGALVTRNVPGAPDLMERPTEAMCDACGSNRRRKDTYVVIKDGVQQQVGSNCLERFMGIKPAGLWMLDFEPDYDSLLGDGDTGGAWTGEGRRSCTDVLAVGLAVIEQHGWVSRAAAYDDKVATADRVSDVFNPPKNASEELRSILGKYRERAYEISDSGEAETLLEEARTIDGDSDYALNLRAVAAGETVSERNQALLLSAIAASRRAKELAAAREARAQGRKTDAETSQWVGQPKDKVSDIPVTIVSTRFFENQYGYNTSISTLIVMRDNDGNIWKWFASGDKEDTVREGDTMVMKGTIKAHDEYQGVKQTAVTRAKLEPATPADA